MFANLDTQTIVLIATVIALALVLLVLVTRRKAAEPRARFKSASNAFLGDFLIPDGEGGEIHIENAMLCSRGIIIVNIKEVAGNVFGSDAMQEWAVITGKNRFTFGNPQHGLYDRVAAVKRLTPDVPVIGYLAFTDGAIFGKGYPTHVISLTDLLTQLEAEFAEASAAPDAFRPSWEALVAQATVTDIDELAHAKSM